MGWDEKDEIKHIEKLTKKEKDPRVRDRLRGVLLLKRVTPRVKSLKSWM